MPQLPGNTESGFTLVEVLVALVLITAVILPTLYATQRSLGKAANRLEYKQEAELLMRNIIAEPELLIGRQVIDTLTTCGSRMRITITPTCAGYDSLLFLTILVHQGSTWDTMLCVTKADAREMSMLSH